MQSTNLHRSPLWDLYPEDPPLMEFGGWEMPRDFGGIVQEHRDVRENCGVFDLSHMGRLVLKGKQALEEIDSLFTRTSRTASDGQALYGFFCNEEGGCLDDAILYRKSESEVWLVVNAANRERMVDWIRSKVTSELDDRTFKTVLLAIQGPVAPAIISDLPVPSLPETPFRTAWDENTMVSSTGYTGEDGGEIWLDAETGRTVFDRIVKENLSLCGLGARDTLRLEKGFPLHGHELSKNLDPVTAGLDQFIDWDHSFVGRKALKRIQEEGASHKITGILTSDRRSPREGYSLRLKNGESTGTVTSGGYSPVLDQGIGLARVGADLPEGRPLEMERRGDWITVDQTEPPFV